MRRSGIRTALSGEVARFQAEVQRLAFAAARAVIGHELARRRAKSEPSRPRDVRAAQRSKRQLEMALAEAPQRQLELALAQQGAPDAAQHADASAPNSTRSRTSRFSRRRGDVVSVGVATAAEPFSRSRNRARWTRESLVGELAEWMLSGMAIDAQFMTRHGPRGLAAAARRIFGRFDAALNVAALHNAKLYPEGPPARSGSRSYLATAAAATRTSQ
jgi:hypothetical protein